MSVAAARQCPQCRTVYPDDYRICPKDGQALPTPGGSDDPLLGSVLSGTFYLVGVIGEGGMGKVYEAEHVRLPRKYAVKVLAEHYARNAEAIGRFEREAQAAARINHPNVLDVVDVVRAADGRPCMVTELLKGEELTDVLARERKLSVLRAISLTRQVCRGLAAAHAHRIVHRDLKPENLFVVKDVTGEEQVKILDFGVAKLSDGAHLTRTGMIVGTPAYMAPEQARGLEVDARTDLYAVGAVLYHLVTGHAPYEGDDPGAVLLKVCEERPRNPRDLDPSIPEALERWILRLLDPNPANRPATAAEVEHEFAKLDGSDESLGRDTIAAPEVPAYRPTFTGSALPPPPAPPPPAPPTPAFSSSEVDDPRRALPVGAMVGGLAGAVLAIVVVVRALSAKVGFALDVCLSLAAGALIGVAVVSLLARRRR